MFDDINPSALPNRKTLEEIKRHHTESALEDTLTDVVDAERLRTMANSAAELAMKQLIKTLTDPTTTEAVKNKAATTILEIAYGKDKQELRTTNPSSDAVSTIARLIEDSKSPQPD